MSTYVMRSSISNRNTNNNSSNSNNNSTAPASSQTNAVKTLSSSNTSNKKKYGKNLNKLIKPASAPPIPKNDKNQSRNGLLLLSTKKSKGLLANNNATNAVKTSSLVSAPNSSVDSTVRVSSLYDSSTSTHTALLSAVVGAVEASSTVTPDAWGTAAAAAAAALKSSDNENTASDDYNKADTILGEHEQYDDNHAAVVGSNDSVDTSSPGVMERHSNKYSPNHHMGRDSVSTTRSLDNSSTSHSEAAIHAPAYERRSTNGVLWSDNGNASLKDTENSPENGTTAIQLSSYEDRSRGPSSAGPRMLYDPKSGCMVEVKPRNEQNGKNSNNNKDGAGKQRKSIINKKATKGKDKIGSKSKEEVDNKALRSKNNKKKEEQKAPEVVSVLAKPAEVKKVVVDRKLPRTCGVLYARDSKGNFYCVDGCEPDLGYGSHSVPGGRIKNQKAFAAYLEENQNYYYNSNEKVNGVHYKNDVNNAYYSKDNNNHHHLDSGLQTGFKPEQESQPMILDWVKAGDKIELVTGEDDSPLLKPTAKEWAPSQAALAAAAAAVEARKQVMLTESHGSNNNLRSSSGSVAIEIEDDEEEDDDDEDDPVHKVGLGFDPTLDMDFVMHSPMSSPRENTPGLDVDIDSLALGPRLYETAESSSGPKHLFSFSSDTWGGVGGGNNGHDDQIDSSDWGIPLGRSGKSILGSAVFPSSIEGKKDASSYLTLSSSSSWGPTLMPGLGGSVPVHGNSSGNAAAD